MKNRKLFYLLGVVLVSVALVFSSCNKDEDDPAPTPTPTAYTPVFSATAVPYIVGGIEYMSFVFTCITNDFEAIKVVVTAPGGLGSDTFDGLGQIFLQNEPMTLTTDYVKLPGTWILTITGNIKSGTYNGQSFVATATVTTSK